MKKTINCKCGIYDTQYRLIEHRDGSLSVKDPYIKWEGLTGVLKFRVVSVPEKAKILVNRFFEEQTTVKEIDGYKYPASLDNVLGGYFLD